MPFRASFTLLAHLISLVLLSTPALVHAHIDTISTLMYQKTRLTRWTIHGAIAARHLKKNWAASIIWRQQGPDVYTMRLFGPLSTNTVILQKNHQRTVLSNGHETRESHNDMALLQRETGIKLPLHHLYFWVRGLTSPHGTQAVDLKYATNGDLIEFSQDRFVVKFTGYMLVNVLRLPKKIQITHPSGMVKLSIHHWNP